MFVCSDSLRPSQQFFSHVGTGLQPILGVCNHYILTPACSATEIKKIFEILYVACISIILCTETITRVLINCTDAQIKQHLGYFHKIKKTGCLMYVMLYILKKRKT